MSDDRLCKLKEILQDAEDFGNFVRRGDSQIEDIPEKLRGLWTDLDESGTQASDHLNDRVPNNSPAIQQPSSSMQEFLTELKIIEKTCGYLGQYTRQLQLHTFTKFSPSDYASKLLAKFSTDDDDDDNNVDWMQMAPRVIRIINRAPGIPMLVGTLSDRISVSPDVIKKERKRNVLQVTLGEENSEKQIPDKVQKIEEDGNSVDKKVKLIQKILHTCYSRNKSKPISFFKFILHPTNFTATVENIFHLCFMIRDGLVRLDIIDDDLVIEPTQHSQGDNEVPTEKHQMVFSITFDDWQNLVETHNVSEPIIQ